MPVMNNITGIVFYINLFTIFARNLNIMIIKKTKFKITERRDDSIAKIMASWANLLSEQDSNKDKWTEIPNIPNFRFLNLRIKTIEFPELNVEEDLKHNLHLDFIYDAVEPIEKDNKNKS
jgi:hypothetical protein